MTHATRLPGGKHALVVLPNGTAQRVHEVGDGPLRAGLDRQWLGPRGVSLVVGPRARTALADWLPRDSRDTVAPDVRAKALRGAAIMAVEQADDAPGTALREVSVALPLPEEHQHYVCDALRVLGTAAHRQGAIERAVSLFEQC